MDIRFAGGDGLRAGARARLVPPGPAARRRRAARAAGPGVAAADFGNGVSRVVDFERFLFVNTDLTVHLHREPAGEWVLLDARTRLEPTGAGLAWSVLHDERGPIGLAAQTLFVDAR